MQKLLTNSVGEITLLRKHATYCCNCQCSKHPKTLLSSASMDLVLWRTTCKGERATAASILDHYLVHPDTTLFNSTALLEFDQKYTMPKELNTEPKRRTKKVIVVVRPYCSPDPAGPNYEQYCRQSLMQHRSFRQISELLTG